MLNLVNPENSKTYNDDISFEEKTVFWADFMVIIAFFKVPI